MEGKCDGWREGAGGRDGGGSAPEQDAPQGDSFTRVAVRCTEAMIRLIGVSDMTMRENVLRSEEGLAGEEEGGGGGRDGGEDEEREGGGGGGGGGGDREDG
eukprot:3723962-Rhodomonas_salina.1